jgi:hypothetical protein
MDARNVRKYRGRNPATFFALKNSVANAPREIDGGSLP